MLEARNNTTTNPDIAALIALKPRQVVLAERNTKMMTTNNKKQHKNLTPNPEKKPLLHHSILRYLELKGFTKTLKRFLSEAQIEDDSWKACSVDLEDMYCGYISACSRSDTNLNTFKEQEFGADGTTKKDGNSNCATSEEIMKKKKKKRSNDSDSNAMADQSTATVKKLTESAKNCGEILEDIMVTESEAKTKGKKRKKNLDPPGQTEQVQSDVLEKPVDKTVHEFEMDELTKKPKDKKKRSASTVEQEKLGSPSGATEEKSKDLAFSLSYTKTDSGPEAKRKDKKKKDKSITDSPGEGVEHCGLSNKQEAKEGSVSRRLSGGVDQDDPVRAGTEKEGFHPSADATKREKKSSKKRKRLTSDEIENQSTEIEAIEGSKRRKAEGVGEAINEDLLVKGAGVKESKGENLLVDHNEPHKIFKKQLDGHPNVELEMNANGNGGEKSGSHKTTKKHRNGSAEPKTFNAFQRVKLDEVKFSDEKLQDNSYWAKDGAEVGYGAKAQEVLGQVRGRDFRHEKTKKKRGSYRGGQIDLQSHSIKFNYTDDD